MRCTVCPTCRYFAAFVSVPVQWWDYISNSRCRFSSTSMLNIYLHQRFSYCEAWGVRLQAATGELNRGHGETETLAKTLREVKRTAAYRWNNGKWVSVVCCANLAQSPTQSTVEAAAAATQTASKELKHKQIVTISWKIAFVLWGITQSNLNTQTWCIYF